MDCEDGIPLLLRHGRERLVSQDTGVGDENMDRAIRLDRLLDNTLAIFGGCNSGDCLASSYIP